MKADAAFDVLLNHLEELHTDISKALYLYLAEELAKRRKKLSDALNYLQTVKVPSPIHNHLDVSMSTKQQISKLITKSLMKNQKDELAQLAEGLSSDEDEELFENRGGEPLAKKPKQATSFAEKLNQAVDQTMVSNSKILCDSFAEIKTELQLFETSKEVQKGENLVFAYQSLLTIRPTSVESERAFSSAGYLCTKFRS